MREALEIERWVCAVFMADSKSILGLNIALDNFLCIGA